MREFRLVAVVRSPDLGDVLGELQERGIEVLGCNVIQREQSDIAHEPKKPLLGSRAPPGGPTETVLQWLLDKPVGFRFKTEDVVRQFVKDGFRITSIKNVIYRALSTPRFQRIDLGTYEVHDISQPIELPKRAKRPQRHSPGRPPAGTNQISATMWLSHYLKNEVQQDGDISRAEMMKLGKDGKYAPASINTAVQSLYMRGWLQRIGPGLYRNKIHNPIPAPLKPMRGGN